MNVRIGERGRTVSFLGIRKSGFSEQCEYLCVIDTQVEQVENVESGEGEEEGFAQRCRGKNRIPRGKQRRQRGKFYSTL
jgi:hypothetical protein